MTLILTMFTFIGKLKLNVFSFQFIALVFIGSLLSVSLDLFASGFRLATKLRVDMIHSISLLILHPSFSQGYTSQLNTFLQSFNSFLS